MSVDEYLSVNEWPDVALRRNLKLIFEGQVYNNFILDACSAVL